MYGWISIQVLHSTFVNPSRMESDSRPKAASISRRRWKNSRRSRPPPNCGNDVMGTRSLTIVEEVGGAEICVLYRQYDGYPTGHGAELKSFLEGIQIVNGLSLGDQKRTANGMDCLAA